MADEMQHPPLLFGVNQSPLSQRWATMAIKGRRPKRIWEISDAVRSTAHDKDHGWNAGLVPGSVRMIGAFYREPNRVPPVGANEARSGLGGQVVNPILVAIDVEYVRMILVVLRAGAISIEARNSFSSSIRFRMRRNLSGDRKAINPRFATPKWPGPVGRIAWKISGICLRRSRRKPVKPIALPRLDDSRFAQRQETDHRAHLKQAYAF